MQDSPIEADDRCEPLRQGLARLDAEIAQVEDHLSDPDIPAGLRERLEALLARLRVRRRTILASLKACEARFDEPRPTGPASPEDAPMADDGDPCASIREQLFLVDDEFVAVTTRLADPDLPPDLRAELEGRLPQIEQSQRQLLGALAACESRPPVPLEP